jgi:hypothetical protein
LDKRSKAMLALMAENKTGRLARGDPFRADDFDAWGRQLMCANISAGRL